VYKRLDLGKPRLGFLDLARGLGLSAERITAPGALTNALSRAIAAQRPHLIEVIIEAKLA
jgi:thiamine pyrophosphate-dependent acetolactate synthase large subunit-like protein